MEAKEIQTTDYRSRDDPVGCVYGAVRGLLAIGGITGLLLAEATDCTTMITNRKHEAFRVACSQRVQGANTFRVRNIVPYSRECS
jgi:hypothetical protein